NMFKKLLPRRIGPYKIIKKISHVAYELELPASMHVHPVFHISKLTPAVKTTRFTDRITLPPVTVVNSEGEEEFVIEKILRKRKQGKNFKYLVKWKGYPESDASWESAETVSDCEALDIFEEQERNEQSIKKIDESAQTQAQDATDTLRRSSRVPKP